MARRLVLETRIPKASRGRPRCVYSNLTGVGERVHLAGLDVNLETHITDVLNVLEAEELSDVVLVGHSYAGMVVTGVADRAAVKLRSLVYIDAFVPDDGRNMIEYVAAERRGGMSKAGEINGYLNPLPAKLLGVTEPADHDWVTRRMTPQPYPTFSQPLRFQDDGGAHLSRLCLLLQSADRIVRSVRGTLS